MNNAKLLEKVKFVRAKLEIVTKSPIIDDDTMKSRWSNKLDLVENGEVAPEEIHYYDSQLNMIIRKASRNKKQADELRQQVIAELGHFSLQETPRKDEDQIAERD